MEKQLGLSLNPALATIFVIDKIQDLIKQSF
ncbi:uncharacterized protein METZ01_LOCUS246911 [marine metagenome]|uniref:Uncharacterized protein n=1 Tax=marine metagenome TaxID=408172 RepID=A0A382I4B9_9ZZZZ